MTDSTRSARILSATTFTPWQAAGAEPSVRSRDRTSVENRPSGVILTIDTNDFDEFRELALGWNIEHQLIGAKRPRVTVSSVMTPALQVAVVQHATGYCSQGQNPKGTLSIPVPLEENRPMILRGRRVEAMQMGVIRSSEGFELICGAGAKFLIASVAQERVERCAADIWHKPKMWWHSADRMLFPDSAHRRRYLDACSHILNAVKAQPDLLNNQHTATLLEEEYLESLLLEAHVDPQSAGELGRYKVARQAYQYLQDQTDEVPSIRELCAVTGASYATVERGFREIYGMTPKALMTALRLSRARTHLLHPSPTTTVTEVALRWGFVEFGRFSVQYRQRFCETPSETLHKARGDSSLNSRVAGQPLGTRWLSVRTHV